MLYNKKFSKSCPLISLNKIELNNFMEKREKDNSFTVKVTDVVNKIFLGVFGKSY